MTASYLSKAFAPRVQVTVIESPGVDTVGVGEATFSTIRLFFDFLGLKEEEWMESCDASYKLAIRFVDWNAERRSFYHPFQRFKTIAGRSSIEWWVKLRSTMRAFDHSCFTVPSICDAQRSPRFMNGAIFDDTIDGHIGQRDDCVLLEDLRVQLPYAYHFDAKRLAEYMSRYATMHGVSHVVDHVVAIELTGSGFIKAVRTQHQGCYEGDLFIDCTGFRGLLINQALNEPFYSFLGSLPCDRAIAAQVPSSPEVEGIRPYTTATALSSGWVWDIPLFHRTGTGYVYSSAFASLDRAEEEFERHLGSRATGCSMKHLAMRIGRTRNSWVRNCVAIGLSSGFVEPLESTGIFFIQHGIEQLVTHFPVNGYDDRNVQSYNDATADCIDGVRDFLILHYAASTRDDTLFWKATKTDLMVPSELAERLNIWKKRLPTSRTINSKYHGFDAYSYSVMLLGLGQRPESYLPALQCMDDDAANAFFADITRHAEHLSHSLPSLYTYLAAMYGARKEQ
jgi:tryptophan halogenase